MDLLIGWRYCFFSVADFGWGTELLKPKEPEKKTGTPLS